MREAPEDVIRDAALAYIDQQGWKLSPHTRWELAYGHMRNPHFQAAVTLAYRRGRQAVAERAVWLDDTTATIDRSVLCG